MDILIPLQLEILKAAVLFMLNNQIVLVYWTTGLQKVSAYWVPGGDFSALYYILQQPSWHRFEMSWVAYVYPLTQVATATTWFWEILSPLLLLAMWSHHTQGEGGRFRRLLWSLRVRAVFVWIGIGFHVALTILMDVGPFPMISLGFYICFWHPKDITRFAETIRRRVSPVSPTVATPSQ